MVKLVIKKQPRQAQYYVETLAEGIELEMVSIPNGTLLMGSPETELDNYDDEKPQHEVTLPSFFMGKYPITQGQWRAIAETVEKVERELDPDPSNFKKPYEEYDRWSRPVENVSWYDAVEFCQRLSKKTGREYRLPSEAEWEYACRGVRFLGEGQQYPPFHFGETISTDLANYCGVEEKIGETTYSGSYGRGLKGKNREQTTPVGYFQVANGFGLYDMHGNVLEWCADPWHSNYEGAPKDESIWLSSDNSSYVLRGGSWSSHPRYCRSAYRNHYNPDYRYSHVGFRVARSAPRTL
ncbi:formylglycine-generating enzyme family protein [Lusitaniella coriacea LEGE 07157]|uniref:Formylglycine-generating enzyme family protein n=1 Tax=Lusitaniella coriacea LEGE 07157 TaxID=945747 RepID=A0A8J7DZQ6_9CYAN|nr:formylglycine-generating enzyme family protein [Lusitaniella coriacea]MBE9118644.1 formylglycine-generating enzyme family protein [Lusitaniella coriacea LEGE 07157]